MLTYVALYFLLLVCHLQLSLSEFNEIKFLVRGGAENFQKTSFISLYMNLKSKVTAIFDYPIFEFKSEMDELINLIESSPAIFYIEDIQITSMDLETLCNEYLCACE